LLLFKGGLQSRIGLIKGELEVAEESPFATVKLCQPLLTVACEDMRLTVGAPEVVGNRSLEFSY
jgi:acetoacetate decarboxylase